MKLAFSLFKYFPFGGLQRDFLRIAKECLRRGHSVDVYTMEWQGEKDSQIPVTILPARGLQNHTRNNNFSRDFQKALANKDYDLVMGFNKMPGLDVYYAADTCFKAKASKKHGFLHRWLPRYRYLIQAEKAVFDKQSPTKILLISKNQQSEFIEHYGTAKERFYLLPPGIARDRVAPDNLDNIRKTLRETFSLTENDLLLLMVGSGFKTKGLDRALQGIAALPKELQKHTQLWVIGQDNPRIFQQQAKQLGVANQVTFLGGRNDVPNFLLAADLLLHPAYNENTGTVLLEALASGLPVLTTDVCGYAHYIQDAKAGQVIPSPFRQEQFNDVLMTMLTNKATRLLCKQNGIAFAKQADIYSMPSRAVDQIELFL
jgi:UDP-glucose:(heptosyl)LPS alpha-1,3-glucosyltransferase